MRLLGADALVRYVGEGRSSWCCCGGWRGCCVYIICLPSTLRIPMPPYQSPSQASRRTSSQYTEPIPISKYPITSYCVLSCRVVLSCRRVVAKCSAVGDYNLHRPPSSHRGSTLPVRLWVGGAGARALVLADRQERGRQRGTGLGGRCTCGG